MDDYISREAAILEFCDDCIDKKWCKRNGGSCSKINNINAVPAADVRPVVLCRDCRWWTKQEKSLQGRCELAGFYPTGEWFCANGERPNCGEDMREPNLDTTKGERRDESIG